VALGRIALETVDEPGLRRAEREPIAPGLLQGDEELSTAVHFRWRGKLAAAPLPIDGGNVHRGNSAITIEVQTNNAKVQQLASDKGLKVAQNVAAGVAGLVIPVLWFGMDFQGTADAEIQALQARQQYLSALAEQRPRQRQGIIVREAFNRLLQQNRHETDMPSA